MTALDYARKKIFFWANSPIGGGFDERRYPFITEPLLKLSDIRCRSFTLYGPSQSMKTVLLQIATAYRLDMERASVLAVAQSDDDSRSFSKVKMTPFLERIPDLINTLKADKNSRTINEWLWPSHELIISGPGENAQNSKSVRFLHTDEAHLWNVVYPGALAALEGRMGDRWDSSALHCTTAANSGTEIDILYHKGNQGEWHVQCIHCEKLIWPLWIEESRAEYNGEEVFHWKDTGSEDEILDSIHIVCPHCGKAIEDNLRNRVDMDRGACYVSKNPGAAAMYASYRWNCFAPRWKPWRTLLARYFNALASVKLGELSVYEEWVKKYLVRSWSGQFPELGDSTRGPKYTSAQVAITEDEIRTLSIDVQEGTEGEGFHVWCLAEQFKKDGTSKRIEYQKLKTWDDARAMQLRLGIKDIHVGVDCGDLRGREVFAVCEMNHWLALKSGDEVVFSHIARRPGATDIAISNPYFSATGIENVHIGKHQAPRVIQIRRGGKVPDGYCLARAWSKPNVYGLLFVLKAGQEREYGVPSDIGNDFQNQIHSYIKSEVEDKTTRTLKKTVWIRIKKTDHAFVCAAQGIVIALISGFFPLATLPESQPKAA